MPEGSSSAAPVTRPGPSSRKITFLGFLAGEPPMVVSDEVASPNGRRTSSSLRASESICTPSNGTVGKKFPPRRARGTVASRRHPRQDVVPDRADDQSEESPMRGFIRLMSMLAALVAATVTAISAALAADVAQVNLT